MTVTNLKEAKELLGNYKSITLEQLIIRYKANPYMRGKTILNRITNFGTTDCLLCVSAKHCCKNCIYSFRGEENTIPCFDVIYNEMCSASSAEELFNAIQKRISYLTHIIEWYETMDLQR